MSENYHHSPKMLELTYSILSAKKVTQILLLTICCLCIGFCLEKILISLLSNQFNIPDPARYLNYFNFDKESNFPSLYSAMSLAFCSYLLATITTLQKKQKTIFSEHWQALTFIFLFLAIDEICSIHELFIPIVRRIITARGIFYFAWVVPAFILVITFIIGRC